MSGLKSESSLTDHDDGDHSQPINLAAPRAPTPSVSFVSNPNSASVATQPVTLRAEAQKSSLMAVYIRAPTGSARPPSAGHIMTPIMGNQVTSSPHFQAKSVFKNVKPLKVNYYESKGDKPGAPEFKNNLSGWTVIRMPPAESSISQSGSTTQSVPNPLSSNILPSALTATSARHVVPPIHPVIPTVASSSAPMASIIKGTAHQVGHVIQPPYSSHVPRGPAAVASMTSAPKSAVATPILRAPHSGSAMTLASSVISPHTATSLRARSPTLVAGRTLTSPVSTIGHQVVDLQKSAVTHSLQTQSGLVSRSIDISNSPARTGMSHSSITFNKPISISQPIVQHLQQVRNNMAEKSFLKTIPSCNALSSNTQSNSTPAHQSSSHLISGHPVVTDTHVSVVPTITRATLSNITGSSAYASGIVQLTAAGNVPTIRSSPVQPHALHALASSVPSSGNLASVSPHQTLTVISAKPLQSSIPPITLATPLRSTPVCNTSTPVSSGAITTASVLPSAHSRLISTPNPINQATIPIAKVYPQSLSVQVKMEVPDPDNVRTTSLITTGSSSVMTSNSTTAITTAAPSVVTEKRSDSTPVRVTPIAKHTNTSFSSVSPATYLYEQFQGSPLTVHPYSSSQNFSSSTPHPTNQMRPLSMAQHGNTTISSGLHPSTVATSNSSSPSLNNPSLNSLMVAVESRHVTLHPPYNTIGANKPNTDMSAQPSVTAPSNQPSGTPATTTPVSTGHNLNSGQQNNASNHLSPRPSILRKRTNEAITSGVKRNLTSSLTTTESLSPRPEFKQTFITAPSPKLTSENNQENGLLATATSEPDNNRLLVASPAPVIKIEPPDTFEKNIINETMLEASPRKKPRKQLFSANELIECQTSDAEENFDPDLKIVKKENVENVKWVTFSRRPSMSLLSNYRHNWKARHNHFIRYSDVKPKEEKNPTVHELANQKGIMQEVSAWKVYHLTGQMDDLGKAEETCIKRMSRWLDLENEESWAASKISLSAEDYRIINKLTDITKGNLQRSKIAQEQAGETQQQIIKIAEHKPKIIEIINKYASRRPL